MGQGLEVPFLKLDNAGVRACVRACVCVCACLRACVRACMVTAVSRGEITDTFPAGSQQRYVSVVFFSRNNWDFSTSQTITPVRNAICIHTNFCDLDQSCYSNWEESRRENDWFMLLWIRSDTGRYKPVNSVLLSIATYTSERCIQRLFLQLSMAVCNCHLLYQYCYITTIIATIKPFSVIWFDGDGGGTGDSMKCYNESQHGH